MSSKKISLGLIAAIFVLVLFSFAQAGTATIYGLVRDEIGRPVGNASVFVSLSKGTSVFPWRNKKAITDNYGNYKIEFSFPDIVEIGFLATVNTNLPPYKTGSNMIIFNDKPPLDNSSYRLNITIKAQYKNSVLVKGYVKDTETGLPVEDCDVAIMASNMYSPVFAGVDSNGYYETVVGLRDDIDTSVSFPSLTIWAPGSSLYEGTSRKMLKIRYERQKSDLFVSPGAICGISFNLKRDKAAGYICGIVKDRATGKPLPFAAVKIEPLVYGYTYGIVTTDFLGRYQQYVKGGATYLVSTTAAHTLVETRSPYLTEKRNIYMKEGDIANIDFEMYKKP
jgi:hypothetical protein